MREIAEPIAPGNSRPAFAFDASWLIVRFICAQAFRRRLRLSLIVSLHLTRP
jgi:hypothetical protein